MVDRAPGSGSTGRQANTAGCRVKQGGARGNRWNAGAREGATSSGRRSTLAGPSRSLAWQTSVDPEAEIVPAVINPLRDYPPFQKLDAKGLAHARHAQLSLQLSQFLHGEQGADFKYLGMQILIEGLAMAAFGNLFQIAQEPLLKELLKYVMRDESRHVAFGVLSLRDYYDDMSASELADREDFIIYASELMRGSKGAGHRAFRARAVSSGLIGC